MSQDIFQWKIYQTYEVCKGAVGIADDVQVFCNEKTCDRNLLEAMECTRKAGIKLNFDKCVIKTKCCSFLITCTLQESSQAGFEEDRNHQTDAATHKQTTAKFLPRYGNLPSSVYAKYFFLNFWSERFAQERCIISVV